MKAKNIGEAGLEVVKIKYVYSLLKLSDPLSLSCCCVRE
jgi:hypothetical protein